MQLPFIGHCDSLLRVEDRGTDTQWQVSATYTHRVTVHQRPEIRAGIFLPVKKWVISWVLGTWWHLCRCWEVTPKARSRSNYEVPKSRVNNIRREMGQEIWNKNCGVTDGGLLVETAYRLLQERSELHSQEGQICAFGSRIRVLRLSRLGFSKVYSLAMSHSARVAGMMSLAPECQSLVQDSVCALEVTCLKGGVEIIILQTIIFTELMLSLFCCQTWLQWHSSNWGGWFHARDIRL